MGPRRGRAFISACTPLGRGCLPSLCDAWLVFIACSPWSSRMCARCCVRLRPSAAPPLAPASSALRPVARRRFTRRRRVRLRSYWCSLWSFLCVGYLLGAPSGALSLRLPVPLVRYPLSCNLISADQGSLFPRRGFCFPCELSRMALVNHLCVGVSGLLLLSLCINFAHASLAANVLLLFRAVTCLCGVSRAPSYGAVSL